MNNHIEIYQRNSKELAVYVSGLSDLSYYVPYITVKRKSSDTSALISKTGTVTDPSTTYTFSLTTTDTSLAASDYVYEITLENSTNNTIVTIVRDRFTILDSIRY